MNAIERYRQALTEYARQEGYALAEDSIPYGCTFRLECQGTPTILVQTYQTGSAVIPTGRIRPEKLVALLEQLELEIKPPKLPETSWRVGPKQRNTLEQELINRHGPLTVSSAPNVAWSLNVKNGTEKYSFTLMSYGRLILRGKGRDAAAADVQFLDGLLGKRTERERVPDQEVNIRYPYVGSDEAGKGDYLGPLAIAGVKVDERQEAILRELGVRDSKLIGPAEISSLARDIKLTVPAGHSVVLIAPEKYNQLYESMASEGKNLNNLLAWGHARAIEDLLAAGPAALAIADKFGNPKYLRGALQARGRTVELVEVPRAERFIAVAAASILARDAFVTYLADREKRSNMRLPKGAGPETLAAARQIYSRWGMAGLRRIAKLHFKTTEQVVPGWHGED